ncbi:hypothetical protein GCM10027053_27160 [Intrasporangium mesophilum]
MKVVLLVAIGILLVFLLGPVIGSLELGIIAVLDALAIGLVVHRDRRKNAAGA